MKTKRELRKEAIKRLNETEPFANGFDCYKYDIDGAIMGVFADTCTGFSIDTVRDRLIDLLTDDDSSADECIKLPRDENGEVIHLYDELAGYGYPNGGVICKAIVNDQMILVGRVTDTYREWLLWDAYKCHHYKKPTIEDVLREFAEKVTDSQIPGTHPTYEEAIAEYAKRMQLKEETCE